MAPISVSAFLSEQMTDEIINTISLSDYSLILIPGFVQWDTSQLEKKYSIKIRKGPEFASDIPTIIKNIDIIELSNEIPANRLYEASGRSLYHQIVKDAFLQAEKSLDQSTFYINQNRSNIIIGGGLPPPIIAEIVNSTEKSDENILKKAKHYIKSGASIIDIGCISNKPNPERVKKIISFLREKFEVLLSVDSMDPGEILAAAEAGIDLVLSVDLGNYGDLLSLPRDLTLVILPTNVKQGYFPKNPSERVKNLLDLTKILLKLGFTKLIADPLLESPIAPGISISLETYFLYNMTVSKGNNKELRLPLFFGVSNVVELVDVDSIGINGLLAAIAIELNVGVLFTVEHSAKLMNGVRELKECVKLCYLSRTKKVPPINIGIDYFSAKGKINPISLDIDEKRSIVVKEPNKGYLMDEKGYFKIYVNHYAGLIYVLFFSNQHELKSSLMGQDAESLSKKILELKLTTDIYHANYIGRELRMAEFCLLSGKPYLQDE